VEDYDNQFQDLAVADTVIPIIETPRGEDESFRTYAARRARSFGYPNLREQQLKALEKLVKRKTDVILIAKTSFGKSLIFQLAPLLIADPREPGIALIPLTLLQQNQAENVKKRGAHLGARCIVLDQDSHNVSALGPLRVKWKSACFLPLMGCASY
jgi:replicative superfamily II helicase